jgi:protein TonB
MTADRWRRWGIIGSVGLAHLGLGALVTLTDDPVAAPTPPIFNVELFRPPAPKPPPPPPTEARTAGGGAPAAPSRVHTPPRPVNRPPELPAPLVQAPEPELIVGASAQASPTPGLGQGGEGNGPGPGSGDGDGPGAGSGPQFLRGANNGEILALVPPEARRARRAGRSSVTCVIRPDTRLENCRVVEESPTGLGFGEAARRVASTHFRFRPPMTAGGRVIEDARVTVTVEFGRQRR